MDCKNNGIWEIEDMRVPYDPYDVYEYRYCCTEHLTEMVDKDITIVVRRRSAELTPAACKAEVQCKTST